MNRRKRFFVILGIVYLSQFIMIFIPLLIGMGKYVKSLTLPVAFGILVLFLLVDIFTLALVFVSDN